jgi:hemerythrin-like metal-binding protein
MVDSLTDDAQGLPESIGDQHGYLATKVTGLRQMHDGGARWTALAAYLDRLLADVRAHFAREEQVMAAANYDRLAGHRNEHEVFMRRLEVVRLECDRQETDLMPLLTEMLDNWFKHHEDTWDREAIAALKLA